MAQKNAKIDDIKRPEKVTPSATSRPILISGGQSVTPSDPMMVPSGGDKPEGETVQVMSHTAKTITPPSELIAEKAKEEESKEAAEAPEGTEPEATDASPEAAEEPAETTEEKPENPKSAASAVIERSERANDIKEAERDPDAALSAEETAAAEAKAKREEELEGLITSGKYAVPIDAVQRRRSRLHTIVLGLIAVLLAIALLDLVADAGIIDLPSSVPHTHFFSGH